MSALNITPKSFSCVVLPNTASNILYSSSMFQCPLCIHLHFPKFNNICHFSDLLTNLSRSSCHLCLSVSLVTFLNTFVSSANLSTLLDMSSSKSFIYIYIYIYILVPCAGLEFDPKPGPQLAVRAQARPRPAIICQARPGPGPQTRI